MQNTSTSIIGRAEELNKIEACFRAKKNVLLEGPVGVGKTLLALHVAQKQKRPVYRIDGDSRYTEQKLTGWFDPPAVLQKGYSEETFVVGPLVQAMKEGGVLFINELNRLPEGVQNVLLPAIDERSVQIPFLKSVQADPGFLVVATQNPKEFVATSHLSEALLDRFELVHLDYQTEEEERKILSSRQPSTGKNWVESAVRLIRLSRGEKRIRRGASIRAALSVVQVGPELEKQGASFEDAFVQAAIVSLPNRIEIERELLSERSYAQEMEELIRDLARQALVGEPSSVKKKL